MLYIKSTLARAGVYRFCYDLLVDDHSLLSRPLYTFSSGIIAKLTLCLTLKPRHSLFPSV